MFDSVVISSGAEVGGVQSYAESLRYGFKELGLECKILSPKKILWDIGTLRDARVLKILSTTACFAAPVARSSICVAHGFPREDAQGVITSTGIKISLKIAEHYSILIAVSEYVCSHLHACYNIKCDGVIKSAVNPLFLERPPETQIKKNKQITYVGRLHPVKRIDTFFPALLMLCNRTDFEVHIIGSGVSEQELRSLANGHPRFHFRGSLNHTQILHELRKTSVFFSGCETEALGLSYIEALSQGCAVVMPTSGGGIEIAPSLIGKNVFLLRPHASVEEVVQTIKSAISAYKVEFNILEYTPKIVASRYLGLFQRMSTSG